MIRVQERLSNCTTVSACLKSNTPTIGEIRNAYGLDFVQAYLEGWIVNLREFVNLRGEMSDAQANITAGMIVQEFPHVNLADINLIFKNAKLGRFGEFYGRLDGQMILTWFDKYFKDRCNAAAEQSISEAHSMKSRDYDTPDRVKRLIDSAMNGKRG